jgi:hypothetical protein
VYRSVLSLERAVLKQVVNVVGVVFDFGEDSVQKIGFK